ncbi:MAG: hypothetical protein EOP63_12515 [Sphingomonadales bacterium]|nr:MAG: hypothetical protein EOP63_12515 [Sphingomonadales bacterium]
MARKVERVSRGKSGNNGGGDHALPAATSQQAGKSRCPSRKREGIKGEREGIKHLNPFMPGLRIRADGWTVARTRTFLALLAQTGCVADAARVAGVSTTSVNRSRKLFAPFDRACAEALANALRGLEAVAYQRAVEGRETVVIRDGREVERRIMPSDSLLAMLIKRGDLSGILGRALTAEEAEAFVLPEAVRHRFIDRAEFESGMIFEDGVKAPRHIATQEETDAVLFKRIEMVLVGRARSDRARSPCAACGQVAPLSEAELAELDRAEQERAEQGRAEQEWAEQAPQRRLPPPAA